MSSERQSEQRVSAERRDGQHNRVVSNVPFRRNPDFAGRQPELEAVARCLAETGLAVLNSPNNVPGTGRTQSALEYAYASAKKYRLIWWVSGSTPAVLEGRIAELAPALELAAGETLSVPDRLDAVRAWLEAYDRWLLVFDGVSCPDDVLRYLPPERRGHVIVVAGESGGHAGSTVSHAPLPPESASRLLNRLSGSEGDVETATALRGLPLALALAGAYCRETGTAQDEFANMIAGELAADTDTELSVSHAKRVVRAILEPSLKRVSEASPGARDVFALCAFLAHRDIPVQWPLSGREFLSPQLAELMGDATAFVDALSPLIRFNLVARAGDRLHVHPLIQAVTREGMTDEPRRAWAGAAVALLERAFPARQDKGYPESRCAHLLPHALAAAEHARKAGVGLDRSASLLNRVALYLHDRKQLSEARRYAGESLALSLELYGETHPAIATRVNALGVIHQDLGDLDEARTCYERAFRICESVYGPTAEAVFTKVDYSMLTMPTRNLCSVLRQMGDLEAAREVYERALPMFVTVYGPNHSVVAECANHLGSIWHEAGDSERAGAYFEQAVDAETKSEEPIKGNLAIYLNNLGSLLFKKEKISKARRRFERALALDKADYGPASAKVATDLANIAQTYRAQGKNADAHRLYTEAFHILDAADGRDDETLHIVLRHLSKTAHNSRAFDDARAYFERLVDLSARCYGENSPERSLDLTNFARLLEDAKEYPRARELLEAALRIEAQTEGERTDRAATLHHRIGGLMQSEGNLPGALDHFKRALDLDQELHGEFHESVARDTFYLGCLLVEMGDALTGMGHIAHAANLYESTLGKDHPKTRRAKGKLAEISA